MKKLLLILVVFALLATNLYAAGETERTGERINIAVIPLSLGHPWWVRADFGAQKAADELGIDVTFTAPEKEDAARQLDVFNDQVNKGVDAIIMAAVDSDTMMKPISDTIDQGIPVFGFDVGAPGTDTLWLSSVWEPTASGINIGEGIAKEIGGSGKVACLTGGLGSPYLAERQDAIESVLDEYPDIEIVGLYANDNDYEKALSQCESILQANPDLAGFTSTVTTGVPAAGQAIANAGMGSEVAVWGVALPKQNAEYIKKGWINGAVGADPGKMTYLAVRIAYDYITKDGKLPKPGDEYGWAGDVTTVPEEKASYAEDVLLTPDNVDDFGF